MRIFRAVALAAFLAIPAGVYCLAAQSPGTSEPQAQAPRPVHVPPGDASGVPKAQAALPTPAELGLSLSRIRRELRELPPTQSALLRYDFHVNVYGKKPDIDFFKDFDLSPNGPVQYGGMTHAEFMNVVTPQAFRAPAGDLLSVAMLAFQELTKRKSSGGDQKKQ